MRLCSIQNTSGIEAIVKEFEHGAEDKALKQLDQFLTQRNSKWRAFSLIGEDVRQANSASTNIARIGHVSILGFERAVHSLSEKDRISIYSINKNDYVKDKFLYTFVNQDGFRAKVLLDSLHKKNRKILVTGKPKGFALGLSLFAASPEGFKEALKYVSSKELPRVLTDSPSLSYLGCALCKAMRSPETAKILLELLPKASRYQLLTTSVDGDSPMANAAYFSGVVPLLANYISPDQLSHALIEPCNRAGQTPLMLSIDVSLNQFHEVIKYISPNQRTEALLQKSPYRDETPIIRMARISSDYLMAALAYLPIRLWATALLQPVRETWASILNTRRMDAEPYEALGASLAELEAEGSQSPIAIRYCEITVGEVAANIIPATLAKTGITSLRTHLAGSRVEDIIRGYHQHKENKKLGTTLAQWQYEGRSTPILIQAIEVVPTRLTLKRIDHMANETGKKLPITLRNAYKDEAELIRFYDIELFRSKEGRDN